MSKLKKLFILYILSIILSVGSLFYVLNEVDKEVQQLKKDLMVTVFVVNQLLAVGHTHQWLIKLHQYCLYKQLENTTNIYQRKTPCKKWIIN